jgi:carbon monoxide dehydrogenase subunit G
MKLFFRIKKPTDFVFDHLTDMQKFASVHPVISRIDPTGQDTYLVHETLKLFLIPFSFTYPATVEKNNSDKMVILRATVFKLVNIEMKFVVKSDNDYTVIEEEIQFTSVLPVAFIMDGVFRKVHEEFFKNIEMKGAWDDFSPAPVSNSV